MVASPDLLCDITDNVSADLPLRYTLNVAKTLSHERKKQFFTYACQFPVSYDVVVVQEELDVGVVVVGDTEGGLLVVKVVQFVLEPLSIEVFVVDVPLLHPERL